MKNGPSEKSGADQPLNPRQFAEQMGGIDLPPHYLDLIFEVGLGMGMSPQDIFDFAKNSDIKEQLINREMSQERIKARLTAVLPFDDVAEHAKKVDESLKRLVIMMALREYKKLQCLKAQGLDIVPFNK